MCCNDCLKQIGKQAGSVERQAVQANRPVDKY